MPLIVTLLSDFGSGSQYPGQMKAVLASSCDAVFIDITHDIPRHDVRAGDTLHGEVLYVDAFGNLITNIPAAALPGDGSPIQLTIGRRRIRATAARTYGNVARGGIAVVPGSDGLLEVAVREGSAATRLAVSQGAKVRIEVARTTARPSALMKKEQSRGRTGIGTEDGLADA